MMINFKTGYKHILLSAAALSGLAFGFAYLHGDLNQPTNTEIKIRDFVAGTKIHYEIFADGASVQQGDEILDGKNALHLPTKSGKNAQELRYHLRMDPPKSDDKTAVSTLDLLLSLNQNTGNISIAGSGFEDFSSIIINKGDDTQETLTADWAGLLNANTINQNADTSEKRHDSIELAFQGAALGQDFPMLGAGKIEIAAAPFGNSSGSNLNRVQARYTSALISMTNQLSAVMVQQTEIIGMFFDANIQLATQRKIQELKARAHKDYHPSEQMCRIGTFIRSVANSESRSDINKQGLNKILMNQYLGVAGSSAEGGMLDAYPATYKSYITNYCDPRDNGNAVAAICTGATNPARMSRTNKDIDFAKTVGNKLTIDADFIDGAATPSADESDIIALAKNLYFPRVFDSPNPKLAKENPQTHFNTRSFAAKMNVAHSSFLNIIGMKSSVSNTATGGATGPDEHGWVYMKSMLREFGISDEDIHKIMGENPSYYAQMEVLTKKIYQHPNFYTNLYDKPMNVERIGASLDAISLMSQRDRFESLLRREMLASLLVEEKLKEPVENVNTLLYEYMQKPQGAN